MDAGWPPNAGEGARFVEYYNHERLHEAIPRASSWSWPYAAPQIPRGIPQHGRGESR